MTREEAIRFANYAQCMAKLQDVKEFYALAEAALREQEERRWISAKERLPEDDDYVLVIVSGKAENITLDNSLELAQFSISEGWILEMWPEWEDPDVKYWIPLPEPPKE